MPDRWITFDGIENARDLGGLDCGGRTVRGGRLLRTALLAPASDRDIARLSDHYGVRLVFDFRSEFETSKAPDRGLPGAENVNLQIINTNGDLYKGMFVKEGEFVDPMQKVADFILSPASKMLADGFYLSFVSDEYSQEQYAVFFRRILSAGCPPVLFHCSQGKDRTGLAAAFLLFALGADRETVLEDFEESNVSYRKVTQGVREEVTRRGGTPEDLEVAQGLLGVNVRWFKEALNLIDSRYGGMQAYLRDCLLLSSEDISQLRAAYLD